MDYESKQTTTAEDTVSHLAVQVCQVLLVVQVYPEVQVCSEYDLAHLLHLVDVKYRF